MLIIAPVHTLNFKWYEEDENNNNNTPWKPEKQRKIGITRQNSKSEINPNAFQYKAFGFIAEEFSRIFFFSSRANEVYAKMCDTRNTV